MDVADKFKINLNQNLWGLLITYIAVGYLSAMGFMSCGG